VNLSDLAAMGGSPAAYLLTAGVPPGATADDLEALARGLRDAEREWAVTLAGGHTFHREEGWLLSISLLGLAPSEGALTRSGARPGDELFVTGSLGGAARGLQLLETGKTEGATGADADALQRLLAPVPRLSTGQQLARAGATACMDLSDGIALDLRRLCEASGVGGLLEETAIPCHPSIQGLDGAARLGLALGGGEDYELLFSASPGGAIEDATRVGEVLPGESGLILRREDGSEEALPRLGHDHLLRGRGERA
jgi:thiamine-monophosphate kinase